MIQQFQYVFTDKLTKLNIFNYEREGRKIFGHDKINKNVSRALFLALLIRNLRTIIVYACRTQQQPASFWIIFGHLISVATHLVCIPYSVVVVVLAQTLLYRLVKKFEVVKWTTQSLFLCKEFPCHSVANF